MDSALGQSADILALLGALGGVITLVIGLRTGKESLLRIGRNYTWLIVAGAILATVAMQHALITCNFHLAYVKDNDSLQTPIVFRITAMWSALQGSILLWGLILAAYIAAVAIRFRSRVTDPLVSWALVTCYVIAAFFFGLMCTASNPFITLAGPAVTNGNGSDPLLQNNLLVAFHPPLLYLGLVGFTVPFAFAVGGLITGRAGEGWLLITRRWTLVAWACLSGGLVLGAWWSYQVLGWGGYWAWDPVENAALLPWLTGTAFIHSVMVQERRGMLRVWNISLILSTFSLTVLCTFLTRSGVLASVHSFSNSDIGPYLLAFFALCVVVSVGLIIWRGDILRSPGSIDSPLSREAAFLGNNLLFGAFAVVVLTGTVFPLLVQAINGSTVTVGAPYFDTLSMPIVVCLLFLMAIAPVLPWRKASTELLRRRLTWPLIAGVGTLVGCVVFGLRGLNPLLAFGLGGFAGGSALRQLVLATRRQGIRGLVGRANGGMVVHLGIILIAVSFAASHSFAHRTQLKLKPGQTAYALGHKFTYLGMQSNVQTRTRTYTGALIRVDDKRIQEPEISTYGLNDPVPTPSIHEFPGYDLYLAMASTGNPVAINVIIEPMISWLWVGGLMVAAGAMLSAFPGRSRRKPTDPVSAPVSAGAGDGRPDEAPQAPRPEVAGVARTLSAEAGS